MKIALITGGASGFGLEFARLAIADQYNVVLVDINTAALGLAKHDLLIENPKASVYTICQNLAVVNASNELYQELKRRDLEVDLLINNVGIGDFGLFAESSWHKQSLVLELNINLLTHLTHLILPDMLMRRQGKILNVSSMAAFQPSPFMATYYASKAYVVSFSHALSNEVQGSGVSVTVYCPGPTPTGFQQTAGGSKGEVKKSIFLDNAKHVAKVGYLACKQGKTLAINTWANWFLSCFAKILPLKTATKLARTVQEKNRKSLFTKK